MADRLFTGDGICHGCGQPIPDGHRSMCPWCREQDRLMAEADALIEASRVYACIGCGKAIAHGGYCGDCAREIERSPREERQADMYPWEVR